MTKRTKPAPTPATLPPLTKKQAAPFRFLASHFIAHQRFPTLREIMDETGLSSTCGVVCHMGALMKKGYVIRCPEHKSRAFAIPGLSEAIQQAVTEHINAMFDQSTRKA
jgi:SOS-response transcriptional repressor LexA